MVAEKNFVFSTDSCHADSIKAEERLRRGFSQQHIIEGQATRKPIVFKLLLANDENKLQLYKTTTLGVGKQGGGLSARKMWDCRGSGGRQALPAERIRSSAMRVYQNLLALNYGHQMRIAPIFNHNWYNDEFQVTVQKIHELVSNQEEADTRVVLYFSYAVKLGYKSAVVSPPDSDIFFILLHYAHSIPLTINLDTGSGKHRQIVNVSELSESKGADYCSSMLGLYVFTGKYVTSAFKGKG